MSATTSATNLDLTIPSGTDDFIIVSGPITKGADTSVSRPLSRQPSHSSDSRSWDLINLKRSDEHLSGLEPTTTTKGDTADKTKPKDEEAVTNATSLEQGHGISNPPPQRGLRTVPKYTNLRAKVPRETKHVAGLPVIWAKTGDPKHDLQLFDRVYLGKEDPNKTSFY